MAKKNTIQPLLSDDEIEDLLKDAEEKEKPKRATKKPIEKFSKPLSMEIPEEKPKLKVVKKPTKKAEEDIIKTLKKIEPKKEEIIIPVEKTPDIEYIIKETSRFDLNWYFIKEKFIRFKHWLISPYTRYVNWFNKKFNSPKVLKEEIFPENVEDLYEEIKKDFKPNISKLMEHHTAKIPIVKEDISMQDIEKIFDEMRPAMIKQIYENVNKLNQDRMRKVIIKGGF
jgi:hypothetical protein